MDLNKLMGQGFKGVGEGNEWGLLNVYSKAFWLIISTAAFFLLGMSSLLYYPGDIVVLLLFQFVFLLMFLLAWVRPFVCSYFFVALFLFLGFCLKFNAHFIVAYPFVEPIGDFDGTPEVWDQALLGAAAAALGVVIFRGLQLFRYYFHPSLRPIANQVVPSWYLRFPGVVWGVAVLCAVFLYVMNYFFAFFQIGVNSHVALPFGLGAVLAWLCYCGAIIAFYLVLDWESKRREDRTWPMVWSLCLLGILVSVSLLSRATMIFLYLSFVLTLFFYNKHIFFKLWSAWRWRVLVLPVVSLFISLFLVSWLRMNIYDYTSSATAAVPPAKGSIVEQIEPPRSEVIGVTPTLMFVEVMRLGVDRWIGLEGMMVFAASEARGLPMLMGILSESPGAGIDSIYQKLSNSPYKFMENFTYLTLPGAPALLFSSGSFIITFAGMFLLTTLLSIFERFTFWASQSRFVTAWVGVLMANAVCQMNFPYLWGVFVVESFLALCALAFILRRA